MVRAVCNRSECAQRALGSEATAASPLPGLPVALGRSHTHSTYTSRGPADRKRTRLAGCIRLDRLHRATCVHVRPGLIRLRLRILFEVYAVWVFGCIEPRRNRACMLRARGRGDRRGLTPAAPRSRDGRVALAFRQAAWQHALASRSLPDRRSGARFSMDWIIAHRGGNIERPECTVAAIEYSANIGCTAAECDVRLTRDGALVVLHDPTLDRTTNGTGPIREATLAEVQQLVAGQV